MLYIIIFLSLLLILLNLNKKQKQEKFSTKHNVYLISNKPDLNSDYIKKVNSLKLNANDKVVRFNHSGNPQILDGRTDIAILRNNDKSYWGYKSNMWNNLTNKEIILLGKNSNTEKCIFEGDKKGNNVKVVNYDKVEGKTESSGKLGINYFLKDSNVNKIYLIGFTFYDGKVNWHNFKKEKEILKEHPEKIVQI